MYIIRTIPGSQQRDFYIKVGAARKTDIKWTPDKSRAGKFLSRKVAEQHLRVANTWCKCEIVEINVDEVDKQENNSTCYDDYDRAMGIIK